MNFSVWRDLLYDSLITNNNYSDEVNYSFYHDNPHIEFDYESLKPNLKRAAVLIALYWNGSGFRVILTKRSEKLKNHSGQYAFAGGRLDENDESLVSTAIREATEEIGLIPAKIEIIGVADNYLTGTGYLITPVVGIIDDISHLKPNPDEVEIIFDLDFHFLIDQNNISMHNKYVGGITRFFHIINCEGYEIWGATAGILHSLSNRLKTTNAKKYLFNTGGQIGN